MFSVFTHVKEPFSANSVELAVETLSVIKSKSAMYLIVLIILNLIVVVFVFKCVIINF